MADENDHVLEDLTSSFSSQNSAEGELILPDRPWVQDHFMIEEQNGKRKRFCKAKGCTAAYNFYASHQVLRGHWRSKHEGKDMRGNASVVRVDEQDAMDAMYKWILKSKQSYSVTKNDDFRFFISKLNPCFGLPNRSTVHHKVLDKSDHVRTMIDKELKNADSVATTFDMWTSSNGFGYGCLTGHFFDTKGNLRSLVLEFKLIPHPHDGETIYKFLKDTLKAFKIEKKVISITTDNASNNISAINMLVSDLNLESNFPVGFLKFRCAAHILNLAVQQALVEVQPVVSTIKTITLIVKGSSARTESFHSIQRDIGTNKPLQMVNDLPTRWNSTFAMLERAVRLKESIDQAQSVMRELKDTRQVDWLQVEEVVKFLRPFNELTEQFSGEKYPTLPLIMAVFPSLMKHLTEEYWLDETVRIAVRAFRVKLEEYEGYLDQPVANIATVLDPRFKLSCLDTVAHRFIKDLLNKSIQDIHPPVTRPAATTSLLSRIFVQPCADEVETYCSEPRANEKCDVSKYWKEYASGKFPKLAKLAGIVLNIQATSVPCERANSRASLVNDPLRGSLTAESLRANVLMNSWLRYFDDQ